jgi:hypothetical protein
LPETAAEMLVFSVLITGKDGGKITPLLLRAEAETRAVILASWRTLSCYFMFKFWSACADIPRS